MSKTPFETLRDTHRLSRLPETLHIPAISGMASRRVETGRATLDDITLAILALEEERDMLYRRISDLQDIARFARRAAALGPDNAAAFAIKHLEARA